MRIHLHTHTRSHRHRHRAGPSIKAFFSGPHTRPRIRRNGDGVFFYGTSSSSATPAHGPKGPLREISRTHRGADGDCESDNAATRHIAPMVFRCCLDSGGGGREWWWNALRWVTFSHKQARTHARKRASLCAKKSQPGEPTCAPGDWNICAKIQATEKNRKPGMGKEVSE